MLARTIDKLRATLPGGNFGAYQIPGFSARMLSALGIEESALRDVVARGSSDDEVVQWVRTHSDPSRYDEFNASLEGRRVRDRIDDAAFRAKYGWITQESPAEILDMPLLDMLVLDDARSFSGASTAKR